MGFGRLSDNDDCYPLKSRLLEVGETLVNCQSKEKKVLNKLESVRNELSKLEQKKAAIDAERLTSKRSNSPLLERQSLRSKRIEDLLKSKKEKSSQLKSINLVITPLEADLLKIQNEEKNLDKSSDSSVWSKFQKEFK